MKVKDITGLIGGEIITLIDATRTGYMTRPQEIIQADKNVIGARYGEMDVVHMDFPRKNSLRLYVKGASPEAL